MESGVDRSWKSRLGSNETATQITTSGRCGSSVAQRSHIIHTRVCVCMCVCVLYYYIVNNIFTRIVRMFYISPGLLCGSPSIYLYKGRKKKYTILISRTTYCTSCGRSANTRRRMELLKDRKYAYKYVPLAHRRYTSFERKRIDGKLYNIIIITYRVIISIDFSFR